MAHDLRRRVSREHELREAGDDYDFSDDFGDNDLLSTKNIPARAGFVQRWVRISIRGVEDHSNVQKKMAKGWKPRMASTVPKGQFVATVKFLNDEVIGSPQGMILMERPEVLNAREKIHVRQMVNLQMEAVENNVFNVDGKNKPSFNVKKSSKTGREAIIDE
jgi:hypothetical protein